MEDGPVGSSSRSEDLPRLGEPARHLAGVEPASRARLWLIVLVAGVVALALGLGLGILTGFLLDDGDGEGDSDAPVGAASARPTEGTDDPAGDAGDDVVPQRCIDAVELADDGLVLLDRAVGSVGDLDPGSLDAVLESADELRPDLERAIEDCRADL